MLLDWSLKKIFDLICRLLIWEEFHCEPSKFSPPTRISGTGSGEIPLGEWERCWASLEICSSELGIHAGDRVFALINKMLTNNQVNIVGEGYGFCIFQLCCSSCIQTFFFSSSLLGSYYQVHKPYFLVLFRIVGRAAFTGNHQWILSNNYSRDVHPPEV